MTACCPAWTASSVRTLHSCSKKQGVRVFANSMVQRVEQGEDGLTVHFTTRGKEDAVTGEAVLSAFGRSPNWKGLFADGLQPETDGRRIHNG